MLQMRLEGLHIGCIHDMLWLPVVYIDQSEQGPRKDIKLRAINTVKQLFAVLHAHATPISGKPGSPTQKEKAATHGGALPSVTRWRTPTMDMSRRDCNGASENDMRASECESTVCSKNRS